LQNRDRVAAASAAIAANPRQVLILDDAFQHRRLARDLDIVLLDALAPFGYERLLPRGLLREPIAALSRAHVIALSRSDAVASARRDEIRQIALAQAPQALWVELTHQPRRWVSHDNQAMPLEELSGQRVAAFCGIGNPSGFRHALTAAGVHIAAWRELPDHCSYAPAMVRTLDKWLASESAQHAVCTRKDLVKIPRTNLGGKRLWALEIGMQFIQGQAALQSLLEKYAAMAAGPAP
jgi:tetraacyldisaccharide 4'-kinase